MYWSAPEDSVLNMTKNATERHGIM